MTVVKGYFDELHFTESNIEKFEFIKCDLIVNIKSGLTIFRSHPLSSTHKFAESCKVIFKNVVFSRLIIDEYDESTTSNGSKASNSFKEEKKIIHQLDCKPEANVNYEEYGIEGLLLHPKSWVTWDIVAEEFYLDDLKEQ